MKQTVIQATKVFGLLVAFYLGLGLVAYWMPDHAVRRHVQQSLEKGDFQEDYPKAIIRELYDCQDSYTLDNFTDALILNQAVNLRSEGLSGILLLPRHDEGIYQYINLKGTITGSTEGRTVHYGRYWHGSTFFARILLSFTSYTGIRYLLYLFTSLLLLWGLLRLWSTVGGVTTLLMAVSLLLVNVYLMQFSLQFAPVLILALGGIIWLTYHPSSDATVLFFALGSLTAFLDLITVPSITLGLPLLALLALRCYSDFKRGFCTVVKVAIAWLVGYGITWLAKWGLATGLTGANIFADAYGQGAEWSRGGYSYIGEAISSNLGFLHWKYIVVALLILLVTAIFRPNKKGWVPAALFAIVALVPFAYYVIMAHPALHHAWYNYRALVTAVAGLLLATASLVNWQRLIKTQNTLKSCPRKNDADK